MPSSGNTLHIYICSEVKKKVTLEQATKDQRWNRGLPILFLRPRRLVGVGGQHHPSAALPPGKIPGSHCIAGWVGHRDGLYGCGKSRPTTPGFDSRSVQ